MKDIREKNLKTTPVILFSLSSLFFFRFYIQFQANAAVPGEWCLQKAPAVGREQREFRHKSTELAVSSFHTREGKNWVLFLATGGSDT